MSIVPINCEEKYWNQALCVSKPNASKHQHFNDANKGKGEYFINNNTLSLRNNMCPWNYNIVIQGMCMKLTLVQDDMLQHNGTYNVSNVYNYKVCGNSTSFAEVHTSSSLAISLIHDILDEFYAKGSELFLDHQQIDPHRYVWFSPPLYPTYIPCFTERRQIPDKKMIRNMVVYTCEDGSVIPNALECNGKSDCKNSEDESQCSVCSDASLVTCKESCSFPDCRCDKFYYQCQSGGCVHYDYV